MNIDHLDMSLQAKCGKEITTDLELYRMLGTLEWCLHNCEIDVHDCKFYTELE